jgi:hypothetical protein
MRSRAVRVTLTLLAIAAIGTAGYFYWTAQKRIAITIAADAKLNDSRAGATRAVFDFRSAQQAYVAAAQNETFWFEKATTCIDALRTVLPALEASTTSIEAHTALSDAAASLQELEQRDRRVRGYVSSGQRLLASDVIFSDGLELVSKVLAGIDRAAAAAARDSGAARRKAIQDQVIAVTGGSAAVILALLLLTPVRVQQPAETGDRPADSMPTSRSMVELDLRPTPKSSLPAAPTRPAAASANAVSPRPTVEFEALARVCTSLARLSDGGTLPAILEQTAATLDASGIVLWIADAERRHLTPVAAHGYAPSVLTRMGALPADAENATAAAFRTGLLQTVARGKSSGALAAPLVSPSGCIGVMSAEMRHGGEKVAERLAAATIIAAQLATIVGPATHAEGRTAAL